MQISLPKFHCLTPPQDLCPRSASMSGNLLTTNIGLKSVLTLQVANLSPLSLSISIQEIKISVNSNLIPERNLLFHICQLFIHSIIKQFIFYYLILPFRSSILSSSAFLSSDSVTFPHSKSPYQVGIFGLRHLKITHKCTHEVKHAHTHTEVSNQTFFLSSKLPVKVFFMAHVQNSSAFTVFQGGT